MISSGPLAWIFSVPHDEDFESSRRPKGLLAKAKGMFPLIDILQSLQSPQALAKTRSVTESDPDHACEDAANSSRPRDGMEEMYLVALTNFHEELKEDPSKTVSMRKIDKTRRGACIVSDSILRKW
eukprot:TRINITY_DN5814_c1_g1_i1.p1 TRINITY_DN5814_c1_g1~~TRINITY_DN5814_c1_g1_i1.p1  ORF type:complete len:126 (+),score=13.50 TRINITY_DN5814_c1_g1_i1:52-429(+)